MDPRRLAMQTIADRARYGISPRVEGILLAFECQIACDIRTERDRQNWVFGQAIWDQIYPDDAVRQILGYMKARSAATQVMMDIMEEVRRQ